MRAITDGRMEKGPWEIREEPVSQHRRWPVWLVVLALCGAPIAIPLAVGGVALAGGLLLCLLTLIAGAGVAGVLSVGAGAVASVVGFAGLFVHGLGWGLHYVVGGVVSSLFGLIMLALFAGGMFLCYRAVVWLLRRRDSVM
ncbi:hypothetical protein [uncultured Intestinimonas sp.]|uniref:hypothetical protein n=1 Tax=uncultured Intestinimonas sp. TaxID=1689265 RepID=UPI0025DEAD3E|nr:hypothetical protein [uncultured Intestinimonas sp.]